LLLALEFTGDLINEKVKKKLNLNDKQVINVEFAVSVLSPDPLAAFRAWFTEFYPAAWDKQIEKDVTQQETLLSITGSPTLEPLTDLDPWIQSLIGVIQLGEENPTENYVDYLEEKYRQDLADSTTWVRGVRENEWSNTLSGACCKRR